MTKLYDRSEKISLGEYSPELARTALIKAPSRVTRVNAEFSSEPADGLVAKLDFSLRFRRDGYQEAEMRVFNSERMHSLDCRRYVVEGEGSNLEGMLTDAQEHGRVAVIANNNVESTLRLLRGRILDRLTESGYRVTYVEMAVPDPGDVKKTAGRVVVLEPDRAELVIRPNISEGAKKKLRDWAEAFRGS